ncbi:MAG TPA: GNAT family N-acetyltransferase [Micropepsaceae bacterium]|nr:GNAT family N-acetyltransferase [Micropepsaceae bacterium]
MTKAQARFGGTAREIGASIWDRLARGRAVALPYPFTRHAFLCALEESGSATAKTGWRPLHLLLERDNAPIALLPLYLKNHSYGEYVFDHGWAEAFSRAGGRYYPKLQASIPFTPATGPRFLIANGEAETETAHMLLKAAGHAVDEMRASSLHITFMTKPEWDLAGQEGFLLRTDKQFHWENRGYDSFGAFLADLSSAKRKNLRKERAAVAAEGVSFEWLSGGDLTEGVWDAFFDCYTTTGNQKWNPPYLTREFFSRVGENMGEQVLLVMAKQNGRYVGGALNFFDDTTLYGRNWGCVGYVPFLHFEACYYQAIDFAISKRLTRVEAGAQGSHKLLRGYLPQPTYSAHYIAHAGLRRAVADYLENERAAVAEHIEELAEQAPFRKTSP